MAHHSQLAGKPEVLLDQVSATGTAK